MTTKNLSARMTKLETTSESSLDVAAILITARNAIHAGQPLPSTPTAELEAANAARPSRLGTMILAARKRCGI
jgi:hypothetical protein